MDRICRAASSEEQSASVAEGPKDTSAETESAAAPAAEDSSLEAAQKPTEAAREEAAAAPPAVPTAQAQQGAQKSAGQVPADSVGRLGFYSSLRLNVLWQEDFCGVAVDQVLTMRDKNESMYRVPLTEFFFWPRVDAWDKVKEVLESKDWIEEREMILTLNTLTDLVTFWQEMHTKDEAMEKFDDRVFFLG